MRECGAVVGDCPGRAALDLLCGKEELQQVGRVLDRRGLGALECGSHRGLELLELERVERGCMWDRMMLMMTSMGLFLSFEGIGNSVQGGCGLDSQMAIYLHNLPDTLSSDLLIDFSIFLISFMLLLIYKLLANE